MQTNEMLPLAIATVPMQPLGNLYDADTALRKGTVFENLDKPFFVTDDMLDSPLTGGGCHSSCAGETRQQEREQMMCEIYKTSFVMDDLTLYLDTHPQDAEALSNYHQMGQKREALLGEFAQKFYPLTRDCIAKCGNAATEYLWNNGPMPWEGACV